MQLKNFTGNYCRSVNAKCQVRNILSFELQWKWFNDWLLGCLNNYSLYHVLLYTIIVAVLSQQFCRNSFPFALSLSGNPRLSSGGMIARFRSQSSAELEIVLRKGLETLRCLKDHGIDPRVLIYMSLTFWEKVCCIGLKRMLKNVHRTFIGVGKTLGVTK